MELQIGADKLLRLIIPLYGLSDAGDYSQATFAKQLNKDMMIRATTEDLSLYTRQDGWSIGVIGSYVDDTISSGTEGFMEESRITERKFKARTRKIDDVTLELGRVI